MFGNSDKEIRKQREEDRADPPECNTAQERSESILMRIVNNQDRAIRRLENQMQLLLLQQGYELVDVPAHQEIRKVKK